MFQNLQENVHCVLRRVMIASMYCWALHSVYSPSVVPQRYFFTTSRLVRPPLSSSSFFFVYFFCSWLMTQGSECVYFMHFKHFWYFSWVSLAKFIIDKTEKSFSLKGCAKWLRYLKDQQNHILIDVPEVFRPAHKIANKVTDLRGCP